MNKTDEQYNLNHQSIEIMNKIINYLGIKDKINYDLNEYLNFIINNQSNVVKELLTKYKTFELAKILNVNRNTITHWVNNDIVI